MNESTQNSISDSTVFSLAKHLVDPKILEVQQHHLYSNLTTVNGLLQVMRTFYARSAMKVIELLPWLLLWLSEERERFVLEILSMIIC